MSDGFVNRKAEFRFFREWVNSPSVQNKGIFVCAKSGIGKSRLAAELLKNEFPNYEKIKVDMVGSDSAGVGNYFFLEQLYRKVIQTTEDDSKLPLRDRVSLDLNISSPFLIGLGISIADRNGYAEYVANIMTYLSHKLSYDRPYIIDIENFQMIDSGSMECLKQLFKIGRCHRFIFEFTMDTTASAPPSNYFKLFSQVQSVMECTSYELKKLAPKEIDILCEQNCLSASAAKKLYDRNDGNLFPLVMLECAPSQNSTQPLLDTINALSHDQRMLLFLIELSQGEVSRNIVQEILEKGKEILADSSRYKKSYLTSQYNELKKKKLIKVTNTSLKVAQDQILEAIYSYRQHPDYYLAWNIYENFHYMEYHNAVNREFHILSLLHAYSIFPDIKVHNILPELTDIILRYPPEKAIETIELIWKQLDKRSENKTFTDFLLQYLADVCIATGKWENALYQIENSYSENTPWQACYLSAVLAANPKISDVEKRITRMREMHKGNLHPYMSITVSLLSYYTRTIPELKVKEIGKRYLEEFSDHRNLNYALLLKIHSNTLGNEEAIDALKCCNKIFEDYHRRDLAVMNMITIASRNVYMGNPQIGLEILDRVEADIVTYRIPVRCHYILNNKSAIKILMGNYSAQIWQDLEAAFYASGSAFEKAIILCNLMIYFFKVGNTVRAKETFKYIKSMDLSQYNNVDLTFILLKNTLYFYEMINDSEQAILASDRLISFALSEDCPEDIKIHALSLFPEIYPEYKSKSTSYLAKFRFQAEFIGYWQCEVCYDAEGRNRLKDLRESQERLHFGS